MKTDKLVEDLEGVLRQAYRAGWGEGSLACNPTLDMRNEREDQFVASCNSARILARLRTEPSGDSAPDGVEGRERSYVRDMLARWNDAPEGTSDETEAGEAMHDFLARRFLASPPDSEELAGLRFDLSLAREEYRDVMEQWGKETAIAKRLLAAVEDPSRFWSEHDAETFLDEARQRLGFTPSEDGPEGERDCNCHPSDCTPGPECSPAPMAEWEGEPEEHPVLDAVLHYTEGYVTDADLVDEARTPTSEGGEREALERLVSAEDAKDAVVYMALRTWPDIMPEQAERVADTIRAALTGDAEPATPREPEPDCWEVEWPSDTHPRATWTFGGETREQAEDTVQRLRGPTGRIRPHWYGRSGKPITVQTSGGSRLDTPPGPPDAPPRPPRGHEDPDCRGFDLDGVPLISPENHFTRVWHDGPCRGPMLRHGDFVEIEDGSRLPRWECMACGAEVYAGLDARRFVVRRPVQPPTEGENDG